MLTVSAMITVLNRKPIKPVHGRQPAQLARRDLHVGHLERHSEHQREIEEVPVIRRQAAREVEPAIDARGAGLLLVIFVGVAQREYDVRHQPRQQQA